MSDDLREFPGELGPVLLRREKVTAVKRGMPQYDHRPVAMALVEGNWIWLEIDDQAVRDWVRGT
jgi:hypothetical protein